MKIIILGAGQVGSNLAASLASEANDITVVDVDDVKLMELQDRYDLRTVCGPGSFPSILREAGVEVPNWDDGSPEAQQRARRALESEARITTAVDIRGVLARKRAAPLAHGRRDNGWGAGKRARAPNEFMRLVDVGNAARHSARLVARFAAP